MGWTSSGINNSLTSGLKLLKNVAAISDDDAKFCGSAPILKRKQCKDHLLND